MKSLMGFLRCVLADASTWCGVCTLRDFKTITDRVKDEGLSFLTITLSTYAQSLERAIDRGFIDPDDFRAFKKVSASQPIPKLFSGMVGQIFDTGTGVIIDNPSLDAIFFVRQISLMFKKINLPCSDARNKKAFKGYVDCENEVKSFNNNCPDHLLDDFGAIADVLWGNVLQDINTHLQDGGYYVPHHGPGATADGVTANAKYDIRQWPVRLAECFPADLFAIPSWNFLEELERIDFVEPEAEIPVKVITVPKTLKTPRIIAEEPVAMQYCQQSLLEVLVPTLENSRLLGDSIGFTDQSINQKWALTSSKNQKFATLDLSEASDRVSNLLVLRMLRSVPDFSDAVQACRSTRADVPGHGVLTLAKFASMGSALCFPMESMVFLTIILVALHRASSTSVSVGSIKRFLRNVRVYGDDIIVPTTYAPAVTRELSDFCLKVNTSKSFWTGKFRESCGMDAYDGNRVTPVYLRQMLPESRESTASIVSSVSLANQLYKAGMWQSSRYIENHVRKLAQLPYVGPRAGVLGLHSVTNMYRYSKTCSDTHKPLVRGLVLKENARKSLLDGPGALMKFFLKKEPNYRIFSYESSPIIGDHLQYSGRPVSVTLRYRWVQPY